MNRRGFLGAILALGAAPAAMRAAPLMPAPAVVFVGADVATAKGVGLAVGEFITIAGVTGIFRITSTGVGSMEITGRETFAISPAAMTHTARLERAPIAACRPGVRAINPKILANPGPVRSIATRQAGRTRPRYR